ncbi:unknown [Mycoplasma sp. CAG:611]|jgi:hypothetical protein|nr:unknown [Mycoplasma sp. CAG:611]
MKKLFGVIFSTIILLLVFWFILGYFNFQNITNKKNPIYVVKKETYKTKQNGNNIEVTKYDNVIYKIIKVDEGLRTTYKLKLWFMEDL